MRRQLALGLCLVLSFTIFAAQANVVESMEYVRVSPTQPVPPGSKILVQEVFWYGCPHCFHLQPVLNRWLAHKPRDVLFERQAAAISPYWLPEARAFFAFKELGLIPTLHDKFFDAIHIKHEVLNDAATISAWVARHSHVSAARFAAVYHSFAVSLAVRKARQQQTEEDINSVPTFVVDGRYRTNPSLAGGRRQMMRVVDYLVRKAERRKGR
ncbi:thiol:disulfide interchange protein DsbA/DsbL [Acidiferrobacter sp.]|uniref:thiol:disulfide interchange protein DsbA/DsbL n=1 Tax=Acidiferrobacter sp. TaxID=1872107 RepID=UPI00261307B8|nr:thiol:disulfide interchange protein DsbA/DsbL [Acidiferrobacter sp.]